jgi:alpha-glucosidase
MRDVRHLQTSTTLPRGWSRTYPNLVSMEAVKGAECYSFDSSLPAKAPAHNVLAAFARNVVGPMDYMPVVLDDNVYPHVTTWAHELALAVVFESGLLHFGDGPAAYAKLSGAALQYLKDVPAAWDDTRFVSGEPGRHVVLARRRGDEWFLAGISALDSRLPLTFALGFLSPGPRRATLIEDGAGPRATVERELTVSRDSPLTLELQPFGGFVARQRS